MEARGAFDYPLPKLNIGCGDRQPGGWVNADANPTHKRVVPATLGERLPWSDGCFGFVVGHHVMQYVGYPDLVAVLGELRRVLTPGGILRLSVPSLLHAVRAHARGDVEWFPAIVGDETSLDGRFCAYVTWYSTERSVFTAPWLVELCKRAGFEHALPAGHGYSPLGGRFDDICDLDDRPRESVFVEARR